MEPSQPADVEFVIEGEQEDVLKVQQNLAVHAGAQEQQHGQDEDSLDIFNEDKKQLAEGNTPEKPNELEDISAKPKEGTTEKAKLILADIQKGKKKTRSDGWNLFERYTCMLNLTDISYGEKGHNKFYKIEVLHKGYSVFALYTKWGRVGVQNPQESYKKMDNKYDAILAFKKKFYDKTHNDWTGAFQDFKVQPGKYTWIQVERITGNDKGSLNQDVEKLNQRNLELKKRIAATPSTLPAEVTQLMAMICDFNRIKKTLKELNFDTEKNPLGRLTLDQIQKGYKILTEIQNALLSNARSSIVIELTNQFYTNIPQNYGMKALPMIDHIVKVNEKLHLLDILKELDITNRYLNAVIQSPDNVNPLDAFYTMLHAKITPIRDTTSYEYMTIKEMIGGTHGPTHSHYTLQLIDVFSLDRQTETQRFYPFGQLPNKSLLWHGSRISNFVGILSEGLRIAPPEAPMTGYMFGKGIYLADVVSKAGAYCHAKPESPEGILILCEVALGNIYSVNRAKNFKASPLYYHSVKGVGKKCPSTDGDKKIGQATCFTGNVVDSTEEGDGQPKELIYNEYVVYDVAQVKMKYLVRVNFNFL